MEKEKEKNYADPIFDNVYLCILTIRMDKHYINCRAIRDTEKKTQ